MATINANNKIKSHGLHEAGDVVKNTIGDTASGSVDGAGIDSLLSLLAGVVGVSIPGLGTWMITGSLAASLGLGSL